MNESQLKQSVNNIQMPQSMKRRIVSKLTQRTVRTVKSPVMLWKKPAAVLLAVILCVTVALPTFAANVEPIYQIMYRISPAIAQNFRLVRQSDEDNGIKMEVVSAYIHDDTAEVYITMQDLTGDRIDETIDLYDSYYIHTPFDSSAHCERLGYDAQTKTATFLITVTQMDGKQIQGDKLTFSVKQFLSKKKEYKGFQIPVDLKNVTTAPQTQKIDLTGRTDRNADSLEVITPGTPSSVFPAQDMALTGLAFVDGKLHVQIALKNRSENDNWAECYLVNAEGEQINSEGGGSYSFIQQTGAERTDYLEYVFSVTPQELADCSLLADIWTSGCSTKGNWNVTFPLQNP